MNSNLEKGKPFRFQPGRSGNPGGRPTKRPISDRYAELVELPLPEEDRMKYGLPEGATYGDALVVVTFKAALKGKAEAVREIREAIEGKTAQRREANDPGELRVVIEDIGGGGFSDMDIASTDGSNSRKITE